MFKKGNLKRITAVIMTVFIMAVSFPLSASAAGYGNSHQLKVKQSVSSSYAAVGETVTFTAEIENKGSCTIEELEIKNVISYRWFDFERNAKNIKITKNGRTVDFDIDDEEIDLDDVYLRKGEKLIIKYDYKINSSSDFKTKLYVYGECDRHDRDVKSPSNTVSVKVGNQSYKPSIDNLSYVLSQKYNITLKCQNNSQHNYKFADVQLKSENLSIGETKYSSGIYYADAKIILPSLFTQLYNQVYGYHSVYTDGTLRLVYDQYDKRWEPQYKDITVDLRCASQIAAPSKTQVLDLLRGKTVNVICASDSKHIQRSYNLVTDAFTVSSVSNNKVTVTIYPNKYLDTYYDLYYVKHTCGDIIKVELTWDGQKWVAPSSNVLGVFAFRCEETVKPDQLITSAQVDEILGNKEIVQVVCADSKHNAQKFQLHSFAYDISAVKGLSNIAQIDIKSDYYADIYGWMASGGYTKHTAINKTQSVFAVWDGQQWQLVIPNDIVTFYVTCQ